MRPFIYLIVFTLLLSGCSNNNHNANNNNPVDDEDGVPNAFGLNERPANPACVAPPMPQNTENTLAYENAFSQDAGLSGLLDLVRGPNGFPSWWGIKQDGDLLVLPDGEQTATTVLTSNDLSNFVSGGERGLLGLAVDPDYDTHGLRVYLYYTGQNCTGGVDLCTRVSRFSVTTNTLELVGGEEELMMVAQPAGNHNGGAMRFGPDGLLYVTMGDGGSGNDPACAGQNPNTPLGKLLRLDVSGESGYTIPDGNPYSDQTKCNVFTTLGDLNGRNPDVGTTGAPCPEIYASGLRNPFRLSFDRNNGYLWIGDVGQNAIEEVDKLDPVVDNPTYNFGWPLREGPNTIGNAACGRLTTAVNEDTFIEPVYYYRHPTDSNTPRSVVGGIVYQGLELGEQFRGRYFFMDAYTGQHWVMPDPYQDQAVDVTDLDNTGLSGNGYGFTQDDNGEIIMLAVGGIPQKVRLATANTSPSNFPQRLSETGCFDPESPSQPSSGMIPYDVIAPLWSDGAAKERYFAIPDGTTIDNDENGDLIFPVGSVLAKVFRTAGGELLETRLFMHHPNGEWAGYAYAWNQQGTDAVLVADETYLPRHDWTIPSRDQCLQCHTAAAGFTLGPELTQLNRDFHYPQTSFIANQLATLSHIGMLDTPIEDPALQPALVDPMSPDADPEAAVRSYLHANCANCHRAGTLVNSPMDLRYHLDLTTTNTCNATPTEPGTWPAGTVILKPGVADQSLLWTRMNATGDTRMPPLGTKVVDTGAVTLLQDWINNTLNCP